MATTTLERDVIPRDEFITRLVDIRERHSVASTDFIQELVAGRAPRDAVARWAMEWHHLTLRTAPPWVQSPWGYRHESGHLLHSALENCMGEIGYLAGPPHPHLARDLCYFFGLSDDEIEAYLPLPTTVWYIEYVYAHTRAVTDDHTRAAMNVAVEGDASKTAPMICDALRQHYGADDQALSYWIEHAYADAGHAAENANMVAELCRTRADQERVMERAERAIRTRRVVWGAWRGLW